MKDGESEKESSEEDVDAITPVRPSKTPSIVIQELQDWERRRQSRHCGLSTMAEGDDENTENRLHLVRTPATSALPQPPCDAELRDISYNRMIQRDFKGVEPWLWQQKRYKPEYHEDNVRFYDIKWGEPNPSLSIRVKRKLASFATAVVNPWTTTRRAGCFLLEQFCACCLMVETPRIFVHQPSNEPAENKYGRASIEHATPGRSLARSQETYAHLQEMPKVHRSRNLLKPPKRTYGFDCEDRDQPEDQNTHPSPNLQRRDNENSQPSADVHHHDDEPSSHPLADLPPRGEDDVHADEGTPSPRSS